MGTTDEEINTCNKFTSALTSKSGRDLRLRRRLVCVLSTIKVALSVNEKKGKKELNSRLTKESLECYWHRDGCSQGLYVWVVGSLTVARFR